MVGDESMCEMFVGEAGEGVSEQVDRMCDLARSLEGMERQLKDENLSIHW